ncbi:MAG: hypothetical protein KME46_33615 [Brasilonema angustatum HA4187-MV1]|jgi:hypothetical protein|nr:hypothetical protein [Brasilonema angustatum HA4187-MV1]
MTQARVAFLLSLPEGELNHECLVSGVPQKGDIVFIEQISGKPYASAIAQVKEIALVVNVEEVTTFYAVQLELLHTMPIKTAYEVVRRM